MAEQIALFSDPHQPPAPEFDPARVVTGALGAHWSEADDHAAARAETAEDTGQSNTFMGRAAVTGYYPKSNRPAETPLEPPLAPQPATGRAATGEDIWLGRPDWTPDHRSEHLRGAEAARQLLAAQGIPRTRSARERAERAAGN